MTARKSLIQRRNVRLTRARAKKVFFGLICIHESSDNITGDRAPCCCAHGARCTCALKKEHPLDPVPEDVLPSLAGRRPTKERTSRLSSSSSMESKPTIFMNGHHKPVHKVNDIHNRVGAPYKIPARSHTIHSHLEYAQRSTDSLPLPKDLLGATCKPSYQCSVTSAPHPTRRRVKSEHGSPSLNTLLMPPENLIPPICIPPYDPNAYSYSPFSVGSPAASSTGSAPWDGTFPEPFPDNYFVSYDTVNGIESPNSPAGIASDTTEVDWSTYNLPNGLINGTSSLMLPNGSAVPSVPPSYASYDGFSHLSHPGLTSSSGDISEVEDFIPITEPTSFQNSSPDALNDFASVGGEEQPEPERYRLSSTSSYVGVPQSNMLTSENLDSLDIDEYLKRAQAHSREIALQNQRMQQQQQQEQHQHQQSPAPSNMLGLFPQPVDPVQHALSVQEAQKYAHPRNQANGVSLNDISVTSTMIRSDMPVTNTTLRNDPLMSFPPNGVNGAIEADERDDGWVR